LEKLLKITFFLRHADLRYADLRHADLSGANLSCVKIAEDQKKDLLEAMGIRIK
jgi:uncharacterized protein YjbI with pentapeptide repeats